MLCRFPRSLSEPDASFTNLHLLGRVDAYLFEHMIWQKGRDRVSKRQRIPSEILYRRFCWHLGKYGSQLARDLNLHEYE